MLRHYRELSRTVHILCVGALINRAGTFLVPFLTLYLQKELNLGIGFATRAMGAFGLGALGASVIGGHLADHIGRRTVMLISLLGAATILVVFGSLTSPWAILSAVLGFALISEMYRPAASAMIADVTPPRLRAHAFGLMYVAINLGFSVSAAVGGFLATISFQWLFWGDALTASIFAGLILLMICETLTRDIPAAAASLGRNTNGNAATSRDSNAQEPANPYGGAGTRNDSIASAGSPLSVGPNGDGVASEDDERDHAPCDNGNDRASDDAITGPACHEGSSDGGPRDTVREALRHVLRDRAFLVFWVGSLCLGVTYMQTVSTFPLHLMALKIGPEVYGPLIALNGLMIVFLQLPTTSIVTHFDRGTMVVISSLLTALGIGLIGVVDTVPLFAVCIAIWTCGEMMSAPLMSAIVSDLAPVHLRARYMGLHAMSFSVALMIGAPLGGFVLVRLGAPWLWGGSALASVVAAVLFAAVRKRIRVKPAASVSPERGADARETRDARRADDGVASLGDRR